MIYFDFTADMFQDFLRANEDLDWSIEAKYCAFCHVYIMNAWYNGATKYIRFKSSEDFEYALGVASHYVEELYGVSPRLHTIRGFDSKGTFVLAFPIG